MSLQNKFLSKELSDKFWKEDLTLATAESCTAGNIAAIITAIPGSSHFYKGGIVAYSDEVKTNLLGVSPETLQTKGAVSEETVIAPFTISMTVSSLTAPLVWRVSGLTPNRFVFTSSE